MILLLLQLTLTSTLAAVQPMPLFAQLDRQLTTDDRCLKTCNVNNDCSWGSYCQSPNNNAPTSSPAVCVYKSQYCSDDRWSVNDRGESTDCSPYNCNTTTGACARFATQQSDCSFGYAYNGISACTKNLKCSDESSPDCLAEIEQWKIERQKWESTLLKPQPEALSCAVCKENIDCASSQMCWQGQCKTENLFCVSDATNTKEMSSNKFGPVRSCDEYRCNRVTGECYNDCASSKDCIDGYQCDHQRHCVKIQTNTSKKKK